MKLLNYRNLAAALVLSSFATLIIVGRLLASEPGLPRPPIPDADCLTLDCTDDAVSATDDCPQTYVPGGEGCVTKTCIRCDGGVTLDMCWTAEDIECSLNETPAGLKLCGKKRNVKCVLSDDATHCDCPGGSIPDGTPAGTVDCKMRTCL